MKYIIQMKEPGRLWEDIAYPEPGDELDMFAYFTKLESNQDFMQYRLIQQETVMIYPQVNKQ